MPRPPACLLAVALLAPPAVAKASGYETTVTGAAKEEELPEERATSEVTRADLDRRVARSLPEALRYEPGVFVQQLAHSQAAAYLRGLTGQQTVLLFDGVRLNNSTWRQGPNQYLFTVDPRTVGSIDVLRGGGSTRHGSDALGGVVLAHPIEPLLVALGQSASARVFARAATSDSEIGGRAEASASLARRGFTLGLLAGVGARGVGLQESAGSVKNPDPDTPIGPYPETPAFASDGRTQLGTGFKELTADGRLVLRLSPTSAFTAAAYLYRQYDAPRTDQCPPPAASFNTCLTYEEQFRHLIYAAWEGRAGRVATNARITLSFQRQHERQRLDYPLLYTRHLGLDDVDTLGLAAHAVTATWRPRPSVAIALLYGVDTYLDLVRSSATLSFTDIPLSSKLPRGAYLDGSSYLYGGAFLDGEVGFSRRLFLRAGARLSWFAAEAPADPESQSRAISRSFVPLVGHAGIEWRAPLAALSSLHLLANVDHSFRAPNLDDLTARLQSGPGFQFESPDLAPERSTTFEIGARLRSRRVTADLWAFETLLHDAILKVPRDPDDCPASSPQCRAAWGIFQLQNAPALSEVRGVEGALRAAIAPDFSLRASLGYVWGEGPRVGQVPREPRVVLTGERVPLSRIPPLYGTLEAEWQHKAGVTLAVAARFAGAQDRLSIADYKDARIPKYGTPGFAVFDLRAGYRIDDSMHLALVIENLLDTPHRYHGSSVNGPARGVLLSLESSLF